MRAARLFVAIVLVGCGTVDSTPGVDAAGGRADGSTGDGGGVVDVGVGRDAPPPIYLELTCNADMSPLPRFERQCDQPGECAIALHQVDCCGTLAAYGIRADQLAEFMPAEEACRMLFPGCGCPAQPTVAEDGDTEALGTIMVTCEGGSCVTFVP